MKKTILTIIAISVTTFALGSCAAKVTRTGQKHCASCERH